MRVLIKKNSCLLVQSHCFKFFLRIFMGQNFHSCFQSRPGGLAPSTFLTGSLTIKYPFYDCPEYREKVLSYDCATVCSLYRDVLCCSIKSIFFVQCDICTLYITSSLTHMIKHCQRHYGPRRRLL